MVKNHNHSKALTQLYPSSTVRRYHVPDNKVSWSECYDEYHPAEYSSPRVLSGPKWADPDISKTSAKLKYNALDGSVDRKSFMGKYKVIDNKPRNPWGRTGISGRGLLGKWGPNHAADPIVTRWKRNADGKVIMNAQSHKKILQFVAIQRKDTKEWGIPGGMVDAEERVSLTLKREFGEETLNSLKLTKEERKKLERQISKLFNNNGSLIYKGYVDDPRNTDNAWMETVAVNFHDDSGKSVAQLPLNAGDDAGAVCWMDINHGISLYASHEDMIKKTAKLHNAHWSKSHGSHVQSRSLQRVWWSGMLTPSG